MADPHFGAVAVFVIIATVQLFTKSDPDVGIMVVGKTTLTAEGTADFKEVCYSLMSDYKRRTRKKRELS